MASAFSTMHGAKNQLEYSLTALGRWSILNKQLPAVDNIRTLHIYDFDNTLFKTPVPNPAIWSGIAIGLLSNQDIFANGGWWQDSRILAATGQGVLVEEPRAWQGWWNEKVVDLVRLSIQQPDALCVLLTGRSEHGFSDLIARIVGSKGLEFDMIGLKPRVGPTNQRFDSTMHFKQLFLDAVVGTYRHATEIRVYEDRPKHTKGFRDFFAEYNRRLLAAAAAYAQPQSHLPPPRKPVLAEIVEVADSFTTLEPVIEIAQVQHMINAQNKAMAALPEHLRKNDYVIRKTVFFTSYMVGAEDTRRLIALANIPPDVPRHQLKMHANNILICPRPCPAAILDRVGGMGNRLVWEVTGHACYENSIWAACVRPVPKTAKFHTDNPTPLVVIALRKGAKPVDAGKIQRWQNIPPDQRFTIETVVGEKSSLRIEPADPKEDSYQSLFANANANANANTNANKTSKRKQGGEDDWQAKDAPTHQMSRQGRGGGAPSRGGKNPRGHRGAARGGGPGRGRVGRYNLRSHAMPGDVEHKHHHPGPGGMDTGFQPPMHNHMHPHGPGVPRGPSGRGGQHRDLQGYY